MNNLPVDAVLRLYPREYRAESVSAVGESGGFSGAFIARVHGKAGTFALRAWPETTMPPERIRGLHRLLRHVFDSGVSQVSVPVIASDGQTLVECNGRFWQLEPWMPGRADFHAHPNDERLHDSMRCLAAWHEAADRFVPTSAEAPWFNRKSDAPSPGVRERLERIRDWNGGRTAAVAQQLRGIDQDEPAALCLQILDLYGKAAPTIAAGLRLALDRRVDVQPCLRDVWHDHVLFSGDEVTGLIDASACRTENVATDLARLLGSFLGDDRERWTMALDSYRQHRPLSHDELALVTLFDQSGVLLSGMTWIERLFLPNPSRQLAVASHPNRQLVIARIRRILQRLEHLVASLYK